MLFDCKLLDEPLLDGRLSCMNNYLLQMSELAHVEDEPDQYNI